MNSITKPNLPNFLSQHDFTPPNNISADIFAESNMLLHPIVLDGNPGNCMVPPQRDCAETAGRSQHQPMPDQAHLQCGMLEEIFGAKREAQRQAWRGGRPSLRLVEFANDRPPGPAQNIIPSAVTIRNDFLAPLLHALKSLHDRGCTLPLLRGPTALPPSSPAATQQFDVLPYLGRVLDLASNIALIHPTTDALLLARPQHGAGPFALAARAVHSASIAVEPNDFEAMQCTAMLCTTVAVKRAKLVTIGPFLADAGFHPASPLPLPATLACTSWARLSNLSGLVQDVTTLGDELSLLYGRSDILSSAFAGMLDWAWNGSRFVPKTSA